jgi:hypothetical protein
VNRIDPAPVVGSARFVLECRSVLDIFVITGS